MKEGGRNEIRKAFRSLSGILGHSSDLNSIEGGYHGYQYNCIVVGSGAEITCYRDEFEFVD